MTNRIVEYETESHKTGKRLMDAMADDMLDQERPRRKAMPVLAAALFFMGVGVILMIAAAIGSAAVWLFG